ncbi:MAG: hypothetical protein AAF628_28770 [Planctomycetota bacterium]
MSSIPQEAGSRFKIEPDPPLSGAALDVTYIGPAGEVEYQVDGDDPVKVTPDSDGKFRIESVGGDEIAFSDNRGLPGFLFRRVLELG